MTELEKVADSDLQQQYATLSHSYNEFKEKNLKLDMSRGKPCTEQLDLSVGLLDCLDRTDYIAADGVDCRNYGGVDGIPEAKELCAQILEVSTDEIIVSGNSSLALMHDLIVRAILHGVPGSPHPWKSHPAVKFLCPSPGYDRHFGICEYLGIEMIPVRYTPEGPDMDQVEELVAQDSAIKGMWCVPKYSNPTGITYSDTVVKRLASMPAKAHDFRIFWDNAYTVHHLTAIPDQLLNILAACKQAGNPDRVFLFSSTSKISFPGAGIAMVGGSKTNMTWLKKQMLQQTIGPDKLNQLRHIRFFKNLTGIETQMRKHAAIIKPKFDAVLSLLDSELRDSHLANWSRPTGGYFISLDTLPGCAKKVVAKAAAAGVILTAAGSTYPYGKDPEDKNIRLAPTLPLLPELKQAMELLILCIQLVSTEQEMVKRALLPNTVL